MKILRSFASDENANIAVTAALMTIPLMSAVGLAVDYSIATTERSQMQIALDAATLATMSEPKTMTLAARQAKLQKIYAANGGMGVATFDDFEITSMGGADASTSASFEMQTSVLGIIGVNKVNIGVSSGIYKAPALVEARFKIDSASGWWGKSIYLYGTRFGSSTALKLLQIDYTYNGGGDPKGYGTTNISTVSYNAQGREVLKLVESQNCTTTNVSNFNNKPAGAIDVTVNGQRKRTICATTSYSDAVVDVSEIDKLYLQMDVHAKSTTHSQNPSTKTTMRTDNTSTSHHLYVDGVEMIKGNVIDIFTIIPCGQQSTQAWEDGGNALPAPVSNADFFYKVTGKCDFSQRPFGMTIRK